ncbi:MAG: hypothetical protein QM662_05390 [Gordonia sp. (in: high G+C Gram-positive bacteria)]
MNGEFVPDYDTLVQLMAVPLLLAATSQSGVPALALDVWAAYELRRAGLDPDGVWARAPPPRGGGPEVLKFIRALPATHREGLLSRLVRGSGHGGVAAASASILGKNYFKQVDVIMTSWRTGPEILISTKRMDSSFGNNAANRVEESYGDAKNLALRHPLAALGFVYSLRSTAYTDARRHFDWLVDLLIKLGREDDAYDACALIVPEWDDDVLRSRSAEARSRRTAADDGSGSGSAADVEAALAALPTLGVSLRHDLVPAELSPARFFGRTMEIVLAHSTVNDHRRARELYAMR